MPYINVHFVVSVGSGPYTYTFRVVFALPTLLDSTLVGKLPELLPRFAKFWQSALSVSIPGGRLAVCNPISNFPCPTIYPNFRTKRDARYANRCQRVSNAKADCFQFIYIMQCFQCVLLRAYLQVPNLVGLCWVNQLMYNSRELDGSSSFLTMRLLRSRSLSHATHLHRDASLLLCRVRFVG